MNCIVKALIATLLCVAVLAGPTMATTIEISTCQDDGFGMIPLAPGEVIQEGVYANGPEFYISSDGMVQYLGDPVDALSYTSINYGMEVGAPYLRLVWITLLPCIEEPPVCDFTPLRPEKIEIYEPVEMGQEIEVDYIRLPSGDVETRVYMDGIEKTQWDGESCIIAEVWLNGVLYASNGITV